MKTSNWISFFIVPTLSFTIALASGEVLLRCLFPYKVGIVEFRDHSSDLYPKQRAGIFDLADGRVEATFLEGGFRLNPNSCDNSETSRRILILGDSNVAAMFVNDDQTLGAQVSRRAVEHGSCWVVDQFGVEGFGPDQSLFALQNILNDKYYDDVVINVFADNDAGDMFRNHYYNDGALTNDGYCYVEPPFFEKSVLFKAIRRAVYMTTGHAIGYGGAVSSLGLTNCTLEVGSSHGAWLDRLVHRANLDLQAHLRGQRQVYMDDRYDIEIACQDGSLMENYASDAFSEVVTRANILSENFGFNLIFLIQPSEDDVTDNHPNRVNTRCENYDRRALTNFFVDRLDGYTALNLYPIFLNCDECYFSEEEMGGDNHWSERGIELAASNLFQLLETGNNE